MKESKQKSRRNSNVVGPATWLCTRESKMKTTSGRHFILRVPDPISRNADKKNSANTSNKRLKNKQISFHFFVAALLAFKSEFHCVVFESVVRRMPSMKSVQHYATFGYHTKTHQYLAFLITP